MSIPKLHTPVENKRVIELIDKNHKEYDVFFDFNKHNHFPHTLLSIYALGADEKRLEKEWGLETYREPLPNKRVVEIDETNWTTFIGDVRYYPNYLAFFEKEVNRLGAIPALTKYGFSEALFPCLLGGVAHPIIHLAFGVEFNFPAVVAEGLGEACGTKPIMGQLLTRVHQNLGGEGVGVLKLLDLLHKDSSLDGIITAETEEKSNTAIVKAGEVIKRFMDLWMVPTDAASIARCLQDLYVGAMHIYATTAFGPRNSSGDDLAYRMENMTIEPKDVKLDFYLMHIITSILAVRVVVPHLSIEHAGLLLKSHLAATLMYYIARGRPPIRPDLLNAYVASTKEIRALSTWEDVKKLAIHSTDLHVSKVVRSLWIGHNMYGNGGENLSDKDSLWFKAAIITLDYWLGMTPKDWEFDAVGLPESWSLQSCSPKL